MVDAAPSRSRLGAYRRLSAMVFPRGYAGKVFLLTFCAAHVPLLAIIGWLVLAADLPVADTRNVIIVGVIATLIGSALALTGLWVLLAPVEIASRVLATYRREGIRIDVPTSLTDEGGRLLANVQYTLEHLDTVIARLEDSASRDGLTMVFNRREGERRLVEDLDRHRYGAGLTLALLDADDLKAVNDRWGHAAGDSAIRHLAFTIHHHVDGHGWVARWGGDEFVAVIHETPGGPTVDAVIARVIDDLAATTVPTTSGSRLVVDLSAGIARSQPGDTIATLLERADVALYRSKRTRAT